VSAAASVSYYSVPGSVLALSFGLDGNLYYVSDPGNLGYLTPSGASGIIPIASTQLYRLMATGADGTLWFTDGWFTGSEIGRYRPGPDGGFAEFTTPTPNSRPLGITPGPDGNMWFVELGACKIASVTPAGVITEYDIAAGSTSCMPSDIVVGPDGALWVADHERILRVTTSGQTTSFPIPAGQTALHVVLGPDGAVWYLETPADSSNQHLARIATDGSIIEYDLRDPCCFNTFSLGPDGAFWIADSYFARLLRLSRSGDLSYAYSPNAIVLSVVSGRDGGVWAALATGNSDSDIARIVPVTAGDVNSDGTVDVYDVFYLINFLFAGGPAPRS
jgi:virginiamycin B lyase